MDHLASRKTAPADSTCSAANVFWGRSTETPAPDGKNAIPASDGPQKASISTFVQFGLNNSDTLPVKEYFGLGFTGFGLVPHRPDDSSGCRHGLVVVEA